MEQSNWLFKQLQNPKIQMELKSNWVIATEQKQCQIGYFIFIFIYLWNSQIGYSNSCKIQKFKWS
jgi:hypothetical protein